MENKKGSMELGVNSIVILIIALVLLGLVIGFITQLLRGGQDKLGSLIDRTNLPIHADATQPIMFEQSAISVKGGGKTNVVVSAFNSGYAADNERVRVYIGDCVDSDGTPFPSPGPITLSSLSQPIPSGSDGGFKAVLKIRSFDSGTQCSPSPAPGAFCAGTYVCNVYASADTVGNPDASNSVSTQLTIDAHI